MRRRDLIIAGLAVGAAAVAEALRPRKKLVLLKGGKIEDLVPRSFGAWSAEASSGLIGPAQAGRLARTLYSEIVERTYHSDMTDAAVMVLAAYGDTQSDLLQLHRPESCYPAVGFTIVSTKPKTLVLEGKALLPGREVIAASEDYRENIVYWTRVGESLPQSGREQRQVRLMEAMQGYVSDGILFRCSVVGDAAASFRVLESFVPQLLAATPADARPALVGTHIARQMMVA